MSHAITEQQRLILQYFQGLDKDIIYQPVSETYLSEKEVNCQKSLQNHYEIEPLVLEIDYTQNNNTDELRRKLGIYKQKSKAVQQIGNLIQDYEKNFKNMLEQRNILVGLLDQLNKETSDLVQKQKKYIDLSIAIKQSLDYYLYLDKFQFNWTCQPSYRQMFEGQLQPILSQLTDAIQFFTSNINYANAKKYLNLSTSNKIKVASFTKSFYIKLLNKQYSYSIKNSRAPIWEHICIYYPKSKPKFLYQFLALFPQFHKPLKNAISIAKEGADQSQIQNLQIRELQIEQFQLNQNSLSLIGYLQKNLPQIYDEVILKFIAFYRINLHETIYKNINLDPQIKFEESFRQCFIQTAFIIASETAYLGYCFRSNNQMSKQFARSTIRKIADFYRLTLSRIAKDPSKNKHPIGLCIQLNQIIEDTQKFFVNYLSGHYETYVFGAIYEFLENVGVQFIKSLLIDIGRKIQNDLEAVCHNFLPKFKLQSNKNKVTEQVKDFIEAIPNLRYCPKQSQQFLVSSLDIIVKSIKQCSSKIQSRIQCYVWNLQIFAAIQDSINKNSFNLVKKQMRLEITETASVFQKLRLMNRGQNILHYVNQLFSVIKTGVPVLNELTLDFNKFVISYHADLKQKFVKDMVYIHAKNIIEFLQKLKQNENKSQQAKKICQFINLKNLYNSYLLSIQNFVIQSKAIIENRRLFELYAQGQQNLINLIKQVERILLDLMSTFYIESSRWNLSTQQFDSITKIRQDMVGWWKREQKND